MKKKNFLILALLLCIAVVVAFILCGRNKNTLDGVWAWDGGEMTISGSSAKFSEINSGIWFSALNQRLVSIGSSKLRNINQTEDYKWICSQIGACPDGDNKANSIFWVDNCTMSLSANRDTLKVIGDLPACGNTPGRESLAVYVRKK